MVTIDDTGLQYLAKLLNGVSTSPFKYVGFGSGTGAESTSDTQLGTELTTNGFARAQGTCTYQATGKAVISLTATCSGSQTTVNEVALFDNSVGGNMFQRHKYTSGKVIDVGESFTITQTITIARAA